MRRSLLTFILAIMFPALTLGYQNPGLDDEGAASRQGDGVDLFDQVKQVLEQASTPLTEEQEEALRPLVGSQRGEPGDATTATGDEGLSDRAKDILTTEQSDALKRADAGRTLLTNGVEGLRTVLQEEGVPPPDFRPGNPGPERL